MRLARWLVPLGFLALGLPGVSPLPGVDPAFTWLNLACAAATAVVALGLRAPYRDTLWAWLLLFVLFAGYGMKTVLISRTLFLPELQVVASELNWLTYDFLVRAYWWCTGAVVLVSLTCAALLQLQRYAPVHHARVAPPQVPTRTLSVILAVTLALSLVSAALPLLLGFGLMGGSEHALPFRLDAFVTRFRTNLAPGLLLWLLWVTDRPALRRTWALTLGALVLVALADAFTRTSRGSLLLVLLPAFMLWLVTDRFTARRKAVGLAALGAVVALYPLISLQRQARAIAGVGAVEALRATRESDAVENATTIALLKVSTRVSGADGWWHVMARPEAFRLPHWEDRLERGMRFALDNSAMSVFNTEQVVGIRTEGERRPPALIGGLALVGGGLWAGLFLLPAYVLLVYVIWRGAARLSTAPVALAYLGNALLFYTSEGGMGVQDPIACAVTLVVIGWLHRWALGAAGRVPAGATPPRRGDAASLVPATAQPNP